MGGRQGEEVGPEGVEGFLGGGEGCLALAQLALYRAQVVEALREGGHERIGPRGRQLASEVDRCVGGGESCRPLAQLALPVAQVVEKTGMFLLGGLGQMKEPSRRHSYPHPAQGQR